VTHDYEDAIALAGKVAVVHNGLLIQSGETKEVFRSPKTRHVAGLTGVKNFYHCSLKTVSSGTKTAIIPGGPDISVATTLPDGEGYILIRGEDIILSEIRQESSALNNLKGIITDILPTASGSEVYIDAGISFYVIITKTSSARMNLAGGMSIWLSFKASAVRFVPG
ncbi:MAG: TOBE domain-containing protein, partial [Bacteroidetes bacterium]|nr:TOBE domain-containing protein [Bacteroidota bacterium]